MAQKALSQCAEEQFCRTKLGERRPNFVGATARNVLTKEACTMEVRCHPVDFISPERPDLNNGGMLFSDGKRDLWRRPNRTSTDSNSSSDSNASYNSDLSSDCGISRRSGGSSGIECDLNSLNSSKHSDDEELDYRETFDIRTQALFDSNRVRTLEDASEMLGVMASHEDLCPATLLLNSILSAYAPSSEPDNRYHDKKKQAAYLLRTARVKFTIDLYDIYRDLELKGCCEDEFSAKSVLDRQFNVQEQLQLLYSVASKRRDMSFTDSQRPVTYCIVPIYGGSPTPPGSPAEPSDAADEQAFELAAIQAGRLIFKSINEDLARTAYGPSSSPVPPPEATSPLPTIPEDTMPSQSSTSDEDRSLPAYPASTPAPHTSVANVQHASAAANRCPRPSVFQMVRSAKICGQGGTAVGMSAAPASAKAHDDRQLVITIPEARGEPRMTFAYSKVPLVSMDVKMSKWVGECARVRVTIKNLQEDDCAHISLKFSGHKTALHEQFIYPLMAGLHSLAPGETWVKSMEVYGARRDDWCSYKVFAASVGSQTWSMHRKSVKLSRPGDKPLLDRDGTVATVNAAITHSVQHERSTEAHAALESVIFTALQQKIFQRPVTLAICLQTLAHLQYRRNDSSGALTLSANVYQLRQAVRSSHKEPTSWALVEKQVSAIEQGKDSKPNSSSQDDVHDSYIAIYNDMLGYPSINQLTEPLKTEERTIPISKICGESHFGTNRQLSLEFTLGISVIGRRDVAVRIYDAAHLNQRFTGSGINTMGRMIFLCEMKEIACAEGYGVARVDVEGLITESVCAIGEKKRLAMMERLMVYNTDYQDWIDVTDQEEHHVVIGSNSSFRISCPMYPAVALVFLTTKLSVLTSGLIHSLSVPLSLGHRVVFRAYLKPDPFCKSIFLLTVRCDRADVPSICDSSSCLAGESSVVRLVAGMFVRIRATGGFEPCMEVGEVSLSSSPYCFIGNNDQDASSDSSYFHSDFWINSIDSYKRKIDYVRGRVIVQTGPKDHFGAVLAAFAIRAD